MPHPLQTITLVCIDTDHPKAGLRAMLHTLQQITPSLAIFITTDNFCAAEAERFPEIEFIDIPPFTSATDYSRMVMKELGSVVETSHAILIQWDGYVVDGAKWSEEFLDYDYIGAPWAVPNNGFTVGNGGFSLRSKKLLTTLEHPDFPALHPEDVGTCVRLRPKLESLGIKFANQQVASRFSFEQIQADIPPFGFHGTFNLWQFVKPDELATLMDDLPGHALDNSAAAHLIKAYASRNRWIEAATVLRRIEKTLGETKTLAVLANLADGDLATPSQIRSDVYTRASETRA